MIFVITMIYEIKEDNWRTCNIYLLDLLWWRDLARRVNSHHVRGCLFVIWSWQEKYFMRIRALLKKFTSCQLIPNELKFQISKWSELLLRIYLQNNIYFLKTLIFTVIFSFPPPKSFKVDNQWMVMDFFGNNKWKCPNLIMKRTHVLAYRLLLILTNKRKLFGSHHS